MRKIKKILCILRFLPISFLVNLNDELLKKDLNRWKTVLNVNEKDIYSLAIILWEKPEYRNLFIYRNRHRRVFRTWIKLWYKPMDSLYIESIEIGGGLFIQHGFATMISAKSIGENCWINQQVTIGFKGSDTPPTIGNNVMITCGAKVLGNISIGNNAIIGANAVVTKDVEEGAVMGGVPARRIK